MSKLADVMAVILAGGFGTRLRSVVSDRSKVLAEVDGQPFIGFILGKLSAAGVKSVVLCTGYKGAELKKALGERYEGLQLAYSHEASPLGTAGALRLALPQLDADPILVLNGDSFCTGDLHDFIAFHDEQRADVSVMLVHKNDTAPYGRVELDDANRIVAFHEKHGDAGPGWINAGVYLVSRERVEEIPADRPVSIETEMFPAWTSRGLYGFRCEGELIDIGTPERYAAAPAFFASYGRASGAKGET